MLNRELGKKLSVTKHCWLSIYTILTDTKVGQKIHMISYLLLMTFLIKNRHQWKKCVIWEINLFWTHSMRVSWSVYELFSQPLYSGYSWCKAFWPMEFKHFNIDGKIVWTTRGTMWKNKSRSVTFHESILVGLWIFSWPFFFLV